MTTLSVILLILALVWFWLDSARAREIAIGLCRHGCGDRGLQFLDQTVALARLGPRWTNNGIRFRRVFRFDFSEEGVGRRSGHLTLVGVDLEEFSLGLPSSPPESAPGEHRPPPPAAGVKPEDGSRESGRVVYLAPKKAKKRDEA